MKGFRNIFKCILYRTDYVWAKAMGYTGPQLADSAGVSVGKDNLSFVKITEQNLLGTTAKPTEEYKYLDGRCRHYKLIGGRLYLNIVNVTKLLLR